jgi:hypothetical protein
MPIRSITRCDRTLPVDVNDTICSSPASTKPASSAERAPSVA